MTPPDPEAVLAQDDWLRRIARHLVDDPDQADDLVQDAWLASLQAGRRGTAARPWLMGVLRNSCAGVLRSRDRHGARVIRDARDRLELDLLAPDELVADLQLREILARELQALGEPFRTAVYLRFVTDVSIKEVARRTRVAPSTASERVTRGLALLRERMDRAHGGHRRAWVSTLLPLTKPKGLAALTLGIVVMHTTTKVAIASALLVGALMLSQDLFTAEHAERRNDVVNERAAVGHVEPAALGMGDTMAPLRTPIQGIDAASERRGSSTAPETYPSGDIDRLEIRAIDAESRQHIAAGELRASSEGQYSRLFGETPSSQLTRMVAFPCSVRVQGARPEFIDVGAEGYAWTLVSLASRGERVVVSLTPASQVRVFVADDIAAPGASTVEYKLWSTARHSSPTLIAERTERAATRSTLFDAVASARIFATAEFISNEGDVMLAAESFALDHRSSADSSVCVQRGLDRDVVLTLSNQSGGEIPAGAIHGLRKNGARLERCIHDIALARSARPVAPGESVSAAVGPLTDDRVLLVHSTTGASVASDAGETTADVVVGPLAFIDAILLDKDGGQYAGNFSCQLELLIDGEYVRLDSLAGGAAMACVPGEVRIAVQTADRRSFSTQVTVYEGPNTVIIGALEPERSKITIHLVSSNGTMPHGDDWLSGVELRNSAGRRVLVRTGATRSGAGLSVGGTEPRSRSGVSRRAVKALLAQGFSRIVLYVPSHELAGGCTISFPAIGDGEIFPDLRLDPTDGGAVQLELEVRGVPQ